MLRKPNYIALGLVVLLTLVLLNLPSQTAAHLKVVIGGLFLPLFGLAGSVHALSDKGAAALWPRKLLQEELERLRAENQQLRLTALTNDQLRQENNQLRVAVQWRNQGSNRYRLASVVGRDTANWYRTVQIDLGSRDGIQTNLAVLTPEGIVGRIREVGYDRSRVVLVGDVNCRVSALIEETRDQGVIEPGTSVLDWSIVHLTYLPNTDQIHPGQRVSTMGDGGIFPKGIPIGKIVDTRSVGHGLYNEARVKLAVNLSRLEQVWVLMP